MFELAELHLLVTYLEHLLYEANINFRDEDIITRNSENQCNYRQKQIKYYRWTEVKESKQK